MSEHAQPENPLSKHLSPEEEAHYRKWAHENYKPLDPIPGIWHPCVQDECVKINEQHNTK